MASSPQLHWAVFCSMPAPKQGSTAVADIKLEKQPYSYTSVPILLISMPFPKRSKPPSTPLPPPPKTPKHKQANKLDNFFLNLEISLPWHFHFWGVSTGKDVSNPGIRECKY